MSIDEFDTPPPLAAKLVRVAEQICSNDPLTVADFAVGTGELLEAAKLRWPKANVFGCDISGDRVARLAQTRTNWALAQCDFLNSTSRNSLPDLEAIKNKVDLAVLNPPFSARGGTRATVNFDGGTLRCSPAMAFVLTAAQYLSPDGNIVALLPAGALHADRDQTARSALRQLGEFQEVNETTTTFPGGNLRVTITYLKRGPATLTPITSNQPIVDAIEPGIRVLRGTLENRQIPTSGFENRIPLVHSTELQGYKMERGRIEVPSGTRSVSGPAVLLHRVGRPRQDKIVYVPNGPPFAITDCVVALLCQSELECLQLHKSLTDHFCLVEQNYVGSGAPYITINRIQKVLRLLGFASEVTSWPETTP